MKLWTQEIQIQTNMQWTSPLSPQLKRLPQENFNSRFLFYQSTKRQNESTNHKKGSKRNKQLPTIKEDGIVKFFYFFHFR